MEQRYSYGYNVRISNHLIASRNNVYTVAWGSYLKDSSKNKYSWLKESPSDDGVWR